ncbi:hypothetical protein GF402_05740 [Candidatus Fermentibacteria bacterium]|nr:hypothetical protein [Candidatus Fermentibacteria bacterium]
MSGKADGAKTLLLTASILLVIGAGYLYRSWFAAQVMPPPTRMQGETTQAYRYARMVAEGETIPDIDPLVMHPRGFPTGQNSILEEYLAGWIHRLVGGDFDTFLTAFCRLLPLLCIPGLMLWMVSTGMPRTQALMTASLYAVLLPALLRTRGESLYRETFALPVMVFAAWSMESALGKSSRKTFYAAAAGALLFVALAAWKVTSFVSALVFLYLLVRSVRRGDVPVPLALSLSGAQIVASLSLQHMRHDGAITSPASILAVALVIGCFVRSYWLVAGASAASVLSLLAFGGSAGHVGAVMLSKIRFLFSHPQDPTMLSPDARLFWVSGYQTPTPGQMAWLFLPLAAAACIAARRFYQRRKGTLMIWFVAASLGGYLVFERLAVLLALGLLPVAGELLDRKWRFVPLLAVLVLQSAFAPRLAGALSELGAEVGSRGTLLTDRELDDLVLWFGRDTEPDEAVLCFWHLSGLVSAYAERPVVTHTFFENETNRENVITFAEQMFQPPDSLLSYMDRKRSRYVIYQADFLLDRTSEGLLYLAGLTEVPRGCAAMSMHYAPDRLDSLELVFEGPSLRVFGRRTASAQPTRARHVLFQPRYHDLFYDYSRALAAVRDPRATYHSLASSGRRGSDPDMLSASLLLMVNNDAPADHAVAVLQEVVALHLRGEYDIDYLRDDFLSYLEAYGPDVPARLDLARLLAVAGRRREAAEQYREVLRARPSDDEVRAELDALLEDGPE